MPSSVVPAKNVSAVQADANGEPTQAAAPLQAQADSSPLMGLIVLAALFATPLLLALRPVAAPITDADIWWHLRVGQWVIQHDAVPQTDPFAASHKPWVAYSWLFEVLVWGLYQAFGLAGILVYRAVFTLIIIAALYHLVRRYQPHFLMAAALTGVGTITLALLTSERPWLFTILFSIFTVGAVLDFRLGRTSWQRWLLPAAYVLWANTHIQFVYGVLILGLACAAPVLDYFLRRVLPAPEAEPATALFLGSRGWWQLVAITAACALATLVNPYTYRIYGVVWEYATQPGPFTYIEELKPLRFRDVPDWTLLALAASAIFTLGRQRRPDMFGALFVAVSAVIAFRSGRDMWMLTLASLAVVAPTWRLATNGTIQPPQGWRAVLPLGGVLAIAAVIVFWVRGYSEQGLRQYVAAKFPAEAAAMIARKGYPGPLFNDLNWGGFLIWSLPELPVLVDGRTNLHGDEHILQVQGTFNGYIGWQDNADLDAANVVLANIQTILAANLLKDERFQVVHEDQVARVFLRRQRLGKR